MAGEAAPERASRSVVEGSRSGERRHHLRPRFDVADVTLEQDPARQA
jgi:hypothetical protein